MPYASHALHLINRHHTLSTLPVVSLVTIHDYHSTKQVLTTVLFRSLHTLTILHHTTTTLTLPLRHHTLRYHHHNIDGRHTRHRAYHILRGSNHAPHSASVLITNVRPWDNLSLPAGRSYISTRDILLTTYSSTTNHEGETIDTQKQKTKINKPVSLPVCVVWLTPVSPQFPGQ